MNPEALARWLDVRGVAGMGEVPQLTPLAGGMQNEMFELVRGGRRMVLRRVPAEALANRVDTFRREVRLLEALRGTEVPHARLIAAAVDGEVLGTPFYVMEAVDGWTPGASWPPPFDTDLDARAGLAYELVGAAACLASVDWQACGLEGFGRPEGFHARQVDRWLAHLGGFRSRELPGLDVAATWLRRNQPGCWTPGLMHGDYSWLNVMYHHGAPARLAAIVDWEMATVGDPLLDLGWAFVSWPPEGDDMPHSTFVEQAGMPSREDLLQHYESLCGIPTDDIDYYVVLARWKSAIVLEASFAKYAAGETSNTRLELYRLLVPELARKAGELAADRS